MQNDTEFNSSAENAEGAQETEQLRRDLCNGYRSPAGLRFPALSR